MAIQPDMIGIVVRDMAAALRFYRILGLAIPDGQDAEPYVQIITPNGYRISWNAISMIKQVDPNWIDEPVGHRMELAFKCDSPTDVDATHVKLARGGYKSYKSPWDAFWGQRYAIVEDPDGNHVSIFAELK